MLKSLSFNWMIKNGSGLLIYGLRVATNPNLSLVQIMSIIALIFLPFYHISMKMLMRREKMPAGNIEVQCG